MNNQRVVRSFSKQTETYKMIVSHEAAHIHIQTINPSSQLLQQKIYYDFNLPSHIATDTQTVSSLYDYLINNTDIYFQIGNQLLKSEKNKQKMSNQYSLPFNCQTAETFQQANNDKDRYSKNVTNQYQSYENPSKSNMQIKTQKLIRQNQKLKKQITLLRKRQTQRKMLDKQVVLTQKKELSFPYKNSLLLDKEIDQNVFENQDFYLKMGIPMDIKLTANKKCAGFSNYKIIDNTITKITERMSILTFKQTVNRSDSKRFRLKIQSQLTNNWIVIGLLRKQLINRQFCYFIKNSIAYSGSMGIIFVDHNALDIGIIMSRGDIMQIVIDNKLHLVQWIINKRLICLHKIPESMLQHKLYPFVMLAHARDCIRINLPAS